MYTYYSVPKQEHGSDLMCAFYRFITKIWVFDRILKAKPLSSFLCSELLSKNPIDVDMALLVLSEPLSRVTIFCRSDKCRPQYGELIVPNWFFRRDDHPAFLMSNQSTYNFKDDHARAYFIQVNFRALF